MGYLDLLFTEVMYNFLGKCVTILLLYRILRFVHRVVYSKISIYALIYDFFALPFHYLNVMLFMMPKKVINFHMAICTVKKPNYNMRKFLYFTGRRLYLEGYSEQEIDNFRIEANLKKE